MDRLFQSICLIVIVGMVHNWGVPMLYERHVPSTFIRTSIEGDSNPSSFFNEVNRMMALMHERFERLLDWRSFPYEDEDDCDELWDDHVEDEIHSDRDWLGHEKLVADVVDPLAEIHKKLDLVVPLCTTVVNTPTTISPRKSRRKKPSSTQTKTCLRELILDGQKHFSEEIVTTDDKGDILKQIKTYGKTTLNFNENKTTVIPF